MAGLVAAGPLGDMQARSLPLRDFAFGELRKGRLALWDPLICSGVPNLGGFEAGLLYPLNWLHLILPLVTAMNAVILLNVWSAGLFTFLWARRRGCSSAAAALAGAVFMFCGPFFPHVYAGHSAFLCTMALIPAVFLCIDGWAESGKPSWCALGMAAVALQIFSGTPQYVYDTALLAAVYVLASSPKKRILYGFIAIYAGGALLAAVQLLTGLQAAGESVRAGGVDYAYAAAGALPPENLLTLIAPRLLGDSIRFPYVGRYYFWETCLFVGAGALALAALGVMKRNRALLWTLGAALILALGAHTPLHRFAYELVPLFNRFRGSAKFGVAAALMIALLAAEGFDELARKSKRSVAVAAGTAVAAGAVFALSAFVFHATETGAWNSWLVQMRAESSEVFLQPAPDVATSLMHAAGYYCSLQLAYAGLACVAAAACLALMRFDARWRWGLAVLVCAELGRFAWQSTVFSKPVEPYPAEWQAALEKDPGDYRVLDDWPRHPYEVTSPPRYALWGYDQLMPKRFSEFVSLTQGLSPVAPWPFLTIEKPSPLLGLLRLRYRFVDQPRLGVVKLSNDLPRLLLISGFKAAKSREEVFSRLAAKDFDPRREAVLEEEPEPKPEGAANPGIARVIAEDSDSLEIEAELESPALLLVTDNYSSGWRARGLPGSAQTDYKVLPADYTLRAIPLSAGKHRLMLEYRPLAFVAGVWISIAALLAYALFSASLWRARR